MIKANLSRRIRLAGSLGSGLEAATLLWLNGCDPGSNQHNSKQAARDLTACIS
jgi:hypothetical protein